jgi:hypothetical protein
MAAAVVIGLLKIRSHSLKTRSLVSHQGEEHFGLVGGLLDVADVVEDHGVEDVEAAQWSGQAEVTSCSEQRLHQLIRRREEHALASLDERVTERARKVTLTDARQSKQQDIAASLEEFAARAPGFAAGWAIAFTAA